MFRDNQILLCFTEDLGCWVGWLVGWLERITMEPETGCYYYFFVRYLVH